MLHAPDFLGYAGAVEMARDHREIVEQGLQMKKAGNAVMALVGGTRGPPDQRPRGRLLPRPEREPSCARSWTRSSGRARRRSRPSAGRRRCRFPTSSARPSCSRCRTPARYPIDRGRILSDRGLDIAPAEFDEHIVEEHVEHSNALHARIRERGTYLTGPLARYALSSQLLRPLARGRRRARRASVRSAAIPSRASSCARSSWCRRATRRSRSSTPTRSPTRRPSRSTPRRAVGHGATEAPRGLLYHRYEIDEDGTILDARIVPPTSQNQLAIEEDLRAVVERSLDLPDEQLSLRCEQAIRNHDPCISCATHFLELTVDRG